MVPENQVGLKLNGTHQLLVFADDVTLLGDNTAKKNTESLTDGSKEVSQEVNAEKTNHNIKIANRSFENVAKFKYFWRTVTNQNCIHEEIKSRLILDSVSYHLVEKLLSCHMLSKNVKNKICKTIVLPVVLYGYET
jgi:hypothetical protein